jgi:hypothetical protein
MCVFTFSVFILPGAYYIYRIAKQIYKSYRELPTRGNIYCRSCFSRDSPNPFFTVGCTCRISVVREINQYASAGRTSHVQYVGG